MEGVTGSPASNVMLPNEIVLVKRMLVATRSVVRSIQLVSAAARLCKLPSAKPTYAVGGEAESRVRALAATELVNPWPKASQLPPLLVLRKTPLLVAAYRTLGAAGSRIKSFTTKCGRPGWRQVAAALIVLKIPSKVAA